MYLDTQGKLREPNNIISKEQNELLKALNKDLEQQEKELKNKNEG